ncbi:MAG: RNA polymerase sigma factor [Ruminococcaceae bacterium]|nr:RNA polymerase sigma factor [Oscillospiraceae bacterium]
MDSLMESYSRFLQGDDSGLEDIIRGCRDGLILYLNAYLKDLNLAEELTEETFVKLVIKRPKFSGNSSLRTWLYAIARNLTADYLRKHKNVTVSLDECKELGNDLISLEESYIQKEESKVVHKAMQTLKTEYMQVLWLSYFEGLSHKEIAKVMKKSVHNTETLLYRARLALKKKLSEEGFVYENL